MVLIWRTKNHVWNHVKNSVFPHIKQTEFPHPSSHVKCWGNILTNATRAHFGRILWKTLKSKTDSTHTDHFANIFDQNIVFLLLTTMASRIFAILNWSAFFGWNYVCYRLYRQFQSSDDTGEVVTDLQTPVLALEGICAVEIVRIFFGDLKGNFVLGIILHAIRIVTLLRTMVLLPNHWTGVAILGSWAVTEVFRYPMYMFPTNKFCRSVRMVVPLVTFPIGAFSEAYGAQIVFFDPKTSLLLKVALSAVLFINGILGPTMAYPALLKKGLPVLGFTREHSRKTNKIE